MRRALAGPWPLSLRPDCFAALVKRTLEEVGEGAEPADLAREPGRPRYLLTENAGLAVAAGGKRRLHDQVAGVEIAQGLEAGGAPGSAGGREKA